jgi:hypothetical protein
MKSGLFSLGAARAGVQGRIRKAKKIRCDAKLESG